jgi:hypothetical protein
VENTRSYDRSIPRIQQRYIRFDGVCVTNTLQNHFSNSPVAPRVGWVGGAGTVRVRANGPRVP